MTQPTGPLDNYSRCARYTEIEFISAVAELIGHRVDDGGYSDSCDPSDGEKQAYWYMNWRNNQHCLSIAQLQDNVLRSVARLIRECPDAGREVASRIKFRETRPVSDVSGD